MSKAPIPPSPSRSLFEKEALTDLVQRYGWNEKGAKPKPVRPAVAAGKKGTSPQRTEEGESKTSQGHGVNLLPPTPPDLAEKLNSSREELEQMRRDNQALEKELRRLRQKMDETELAREKERNEAELSQQQAKDSERKREREEANKSGAELQALQNVVEQLRGERDEKEGQVIFLSEQSEELKKRGDEFEGLLLNSHAEIKSLKDSLQQREAQQKEQEEIIRGMVGRWEEEKQGLKATIDKLNSELVVEGEGSLSEALMKSRQQLKQGAALLKQSMEETQAQKGENKELRQRVQELEAELKRKPSEAEMLEQSGLGQRVTELEAEKQSLLQELESLRMLQGEVQLLQKRVADAEAAAHNSQSAVSHAMDFAYKATQDNELMKKKLQEAGIRM
ncbi:MAG: hypothetical protein HC904_04175 [Blastochloris sp.]|nr:hypothetical protein [Blastochloris sp.]